MMLEGSRRHILPGFVRVKPLLTCDLEYIPIELYSTLKILTIPLATIVFFSLFFSGDDRGPRVMDPENRPLKTKSCAPHALNLQAQ
jgi:hypothetical protein